MTEYLFPTSIEEALQLLETHSREGRHASAAKTGGRARIIAGGTDILPDIRKQKISPCRLVDITRISGLDQITVANEHVDVGAAVTFAALAASPFLNRHVTALAEAARSVGAGAIQHAATWAGNIVQAMPAADGGIVALALDAEARIVDRQGAGWRPVETLFEGPGISAVDPTRQIITHLRFPRPRALCGTAWRRIGRRPALVLPILNCAVKLCLDPGNLRIAGAFIALGPVAPRPFRARKAEAVLRAQPPTAACFARAAHMVQSEANPRSSIMRASREYRLSIIPAMIVDALSTAAERARCNNP